MNTVPANLHNPSIEPATNTYFVSTHNSGLREAFKNPLEASARWITNTYPGITASHVTAGGTLACLAVAVVAGHAPEAARTGSWAHLAGSLSDALDGPIARQRAASKGTATTLGGALFDTVCDRAQEFGASLAQSKIAASRGDNAGRHLQLAFAASSVLPSLTRSIVEAKGIVVAEGSVGSRHTRVTLNCLGYFWNEHPARVRALGALGTALNIYNASQRLNALRQDSPLQKGRLAPVKQAEAKVRRNILAGVSLAFGAATLIEATKKRPTR